MGAWGAPMMGKGGKAGTGKGNCGKTAVVAPPSPEEQAMHKAFTDAVQPVRFLEKEWTGDKLKQKLVDYAIKASKESKSSTWERSVEDFCTKFYESLWKYIGDRHSFVDKMD